VELYLRTILSIFTVFILVARMSFVTEIRSNIESQNEEYTAQISTLTSSFNLYSDREECEDNHCDRTCSHCSHHCTDSHNISILNQNFEMSTLNMLNDKLQWYLSNHYKIPFLEASTKPPLFS